MAATAESVPVPPSIRQRVQESSKRIARVKLLDRLAAVTITVGGLFIIVAVLFIFLFIFGETLPLFRPARGQPRGAVNLAAVPDHTGGKPLAIGTDEYQIYLYELLPDGRFVFFRLADGSLAKTFPLPSLAGATVVAASRSLTGDYFGAGTADGRVALAQVRFRPRYEEQKLVDLEIEVRERGSFEMDPARRPVRDVSYQEHEGRRAAAAVLGDDEIAVVRIDESEQERRETLSTEGERITHARLARTEGLVASTEKGNLHYWDLGSDFRKAEVKHVSDEPITALEYALGANSLLVGGAKGGLAAWIRVRVRDEDENLSLVRAHTFEGQGTAIEAIGRSTRDKSFVTAGRDGSLVLRHVTSERTLLQFPALGQAVETVLITPKSDGIIATRADGNLLRFDVSNPHPEVSWRALFGKVQYEGYARPEYVWQSTGATDDFEAKFSLIPLVFGTIKGTFYALLFAIPLAVMGALYTSQFMHPSLKAKVKPLVEIMAALPSVVVGFIAGLWLAGRVERNVVPVLLMIVLMPLFGTAGVLLWDRIPRGLRGRLRPGMEMALIVPLLLLGGLAAYGLGPAAEAGLFRGDFQLWLKAALNLVYDQRNCLVVGIAMGFAVIPIIFTIAEDAFTSVPQHLTAASLALGASRWQTAIRVVLPTASPGIFSAVMIGFGRAVGETMIVLMATGNTPVLDWSVFNGMRTLSANIAVEIPEAPYGGTLYRTLFLAGLVLFLMTFLVNTLAELVRQRLRERYKAI
jgi:phosphate transport system permease protein